jgi:ABC-type transport system involved in resistance to organic solvents, periplasmic component
VFGFVHWFRSSTVTATRATYHVVFTGSVGGLQKGSTVEFNGVRIGEVANLQLDTRDPKRVIATISVDSNVPIRKDTYVRLEFTGLTGVASVALKGGDPLAGPLAEGADGIPTMIADPSATQDLSGAARELISKLDRLVSDESALHRSLDTSSIHGLAQEQFRPVRSHHVRPRRHDRLRRQAGRIGRGGEVDSHGGRQPRQTDRRNGAGIDPFHRCGVEEPRGADIGCATGSLDG